MFATILKRTCTGNPSAKLSQINRLSHFNQMNSMASVSFARRYAGTTSKTVPMSTESDDLSLRTPIKLDEFYADCPEVVMSDEQALHYMNFAADLAMVSFKDDQEMLDFKEAFLCCLTFLGKLDEVDVKGVNPLGNVLEFYGGNDACLRTEEDFDREGDD